MSANKKVWLHNETREIYQGHQALVTLSPLQRKLLLYFLENPYIYLTKSEILENVWAYSMGGETDDVVYQVVSLLRKTLRVYAPNIQYIVTWRGFPEGGYRFFPGAAINELSDVAIEYLLHAAVSENPIKATASEGSYKGNTKLSVDCRKKLIYFDGNPQKAPYHACRLLTILAKGSGYVMDYEKIKRYVWEGEEVTFQALQSLVARLRKQLRDEGCTAQIKSYVRQGYMLEGADFEPLP